MTSKWNDPTRSLDISTKMTITRRPHSMPKFWAWLMGLQNVQPNDANTKKVSGFTLSSPSNRKASISENKAETRITFRTNPSHRTIITFKTWNTSHLHPLWELPCSISQLEYSSIDKMAKYDWSTFRNYVAFLAGELAPGTRHPHHDSESSSCYHDAFLPWGHYHNNIVLFYHDSPITRSHFMDPTDRAIKGFYCNTKFHENVFENDGCRAMCMFVLSSMCEMWPLLWISFQSFLT